MKFHQTYNVNALKEYLGVMKIDVVRHEQEPRANTHLTRMPIVDAEMPNMYVSARENHEHGKITKMGKGKLVILGLLSS